MLNRQRWSRHEWFECELFHIMTTLQWARWRLKSPASRLFTQLFSSGADQRKHQSSASWPSWWDFTGDRWFPRTKGQWRAKCFLLMTSSLNIEIGNSGQSHGRSLLVHFYTLPSRCSKHRYWPTNGMFWFIVYIYTYKLFKKRCPEVSKQQYILWDPYVPASIFKFTARELLVEPRLGLLNGRGNGCIGIQTVLEL